MDMFKTVTCKVVWRATDCLYDCEGRNIQKRVPLGDFPTEEVAIIAVENAGFFHKERPSKGWWKNSNFNQAQISRVLVEQ